MAQKTVLVWLLLGLGLEKARAIGEQRCDAQYGNQLGR